MPETTKITGPYPLTHGERLERIENLAQLLDRRWKIPGTEWFIGLDGLLGILPGIGDTLSAALSSWIIYEAHQLGAPWWLKARMAGNMFIDWLVGIIPLVGDIFDIGWRANEMNAALLLKHFNKKYPHPRKKT